MADRGYSFDRKRCLELGSVLVVVLATLALFADKAFTIDDPLFLALARHLRSDPFDFFNFIVHWEGTARPMYEITKNPPLAGYFVLLAGKTLGWSELAMHVAFLLPAAATTAAVYGLALRLCSKPLEAALVGLLTPVFLISSTNIMCDTLMLAFWCGSVLCWMRGLDDERVGWLWAAAVLASLASLTKYFGVALVPLLLVFGALRLRRIGSWALPLALPVVVMATYEYATTVMYGSGLFLGAADYALSSTSRESMLTRNALVGLVFAGGCVIPALFYAPLLWSRRVVLAATVLFAGCVLASDALLGAVGILRSWQADQAWLIDPQLFALAFGGASLVALACGELRAKRGADGQMLALWVLGTLAFAAFLNWTNNGRSNLPLAPAVGILIVRRLEELGKLGARSSLLRWPLAFAPSLLIALAVTVADYQWAGWVRSAAYTIGNDYLEPGRKAYVNAEWGFQYYMARAGAEILDLENQQVEKGAYVILPTGNTNPRVPRWGDASRVAVLQTPETGWVRTVSNNIGAGFYASNIGPMPFAFAKAKPEKYVIWEAHRALRLVEWLPSPRATEVPDQPGIGRGREKGREREN